MFSSLPFQLYFPPACENLMSVGPVLGARYLKRALGTERAPQQLCWQPDVALRFSSRYAPLRAEADVTAGGHECGCIGLNVNAGIRNCRVVLAPHLTPGLSTSERQPWPGVRVFDHWGSAENWILSVVDREANNSSIRRPTHSRNT